MGSPNAELGFWLELTDGESGDTFYAHTVTGKRVWERPPNNVLSGSEMCEWWELWSTKFGIPFYYNCSTCECQWERPEAHVPVLVVDAPSTYHDDGAPVPFRVRENEKDLDEPLQPSWTRYFDAKTGHWFYYNMSTKSSTWSREEATGRDVPDHAPDTPVTSKSAAKAARKKTKASELPVVIDTATDETGGGEGGGEQSGGGGGGGGSREEEGGSSSSSSSSSKRSKSATISKGSASGSSSSSSSKRSKSATLSKGSARGVPAELPKELKKDISHFQLVGFAEKHFAKMSKRKGLFKRRVPLATLIQYTSSPISAPLLVKTKNFQLVAVNLFKDIMMFMGDLPVSPAKASRASRACHAIKVVIENPELRDEAYSQMVKQMTNNPNTESVHNGFRLMLVSLDAFPPSRDLEQWLQEYVAEYVKDDESWESVMASACLKRLAKICAGAPRGRVISERELELDMESPFRPSIFGVPLEEVMEVQKDVFPDLLVPKIMEFCCNALIELNGYATEGIFRRNPDGKQLLEQRISVESGIYELTTENPHCIAGLLKAWLRELEEPLVPFANHAYLLAKAHDPAGAIASIGTLPLINQQCICFLVTFVQRLLPYAEYTKIDAKNFAILLAPLILRADTNDPTAILTNTKAEQQFCNFLIEYLVVDDSLWLPQ